MEKNFSKILKGEILSSIFYVAFGMCLILIPDQTVNIICKVIFGLILIAAGLYHIVIYIAEKEKATILDLFTGVITTVLGIFLFFTPQIVIKLLPYLLGAFVLVDSIWKLKGTYRMKKAESDLWKILLIGTVIFIGLGAAILVYPFLSVSKMILFCGCILTVNGVADIIFLIMTKTVLKKAAKLPQEKEKKKLFGKKKKKAEKPVEMPVELESEQTAQKTVEPDKAQPEMKDKVQMETQQENVLEIDTLETAESETMEVEKERIEDERIEDEEVVMDSKWRKPDEELESPRKEIQEMLKNHDEPLEEWKD